MPVFYGHPDYQPPAEWLESKTFHHPDKGCRVSFTSVNKCPQMKVGHCKCETCDWVARGKCKTHNVIVCHGEVKKIICGWEFGYHKGLDDMDG